MRNAHLPIVSIWLALAQADCLADDRVSLEQGWGAEQPGEGLDQYWIRQEDPGGPVHLWARTVDEHSLDMTSTGSPAPGEPAMHELLGTAPSRMGVASLKTVPGQSGRYMTVVGSTDSGELMYAVVGEGWTWDGPAPPNPYLDFQFQIRQDGSGSAQIYARNVDSNALIMGSLDGLRVLAQGAAVPLEMGVGSFKRINGSWDYMALVGSTDDPWNLPDLPGELQFTKVGVGPDGGGFVFSVPSTGVHLDDLKTEALLLSELNLGAATLMSQLVAYGTTLLLTRDELVDGLLQVLVGTPHDELNAEYFASCTFLGLCPMRSSHFAGLELAPPTDLRPEFHDGTDSQAFHIYFYVGMSYFHGYALAKFANGLHEWQVGGTTEDLWAGQAGIAIGGALREGKSLKEVVYAEGLDGVRQTLEDEADPLFTTSVTTGNLAQVFRYVFTVPLECHTGCT